MSHSSYDNLTLISPNVENLTTKSNFIFDEVQGRGQVFLSLLYIYHPQFSTIIVYGVFVKTPVEKLSKIVG